MSGWLLYHGQSGSYPRTDPKTALRPDNVRFADHPYSIRPNKPKRLVLLEICEIKRDCSYLPPGTLRRSSSKKFLPRQFGRGLRRSRVSYPPRAPLPFLHGNFLFQLLKPVQHDVDLRRRRLGRGHGLEHQEALAIEGHVVVWECRGGRQV